MQDSRVADRERQRRWRAAQRARQGETASREKGRVTTSCHAPASDARYADLQDKLHESLDRAVEVSRAGLHRLVAKILGDLARSAAATGTDGRP